MINNYFGLPYMLGGILAKIGGNIGTRLGGGILSSIGKYAGNWIGNYLEHQSFHRHEFSHKFTNVKDGFYLTNAKYGTPIPLIFGKAVVPGKIIWIDEINEKRNTNSLYRHFKSKNLTMETQTTALEYYASFAMALCEGEITDIGQVWFEDEIINLSQYNFRLYKGDEAQMPDPIMIKSSGEKTPAYRGLAYILN